MGDEASRDGEGKCNGVSKENEISYFLFEKASKKFAHIFSAWSSFSFLPYVSAVIALLVCAGM
jgi:hypothetical protein